MKIGIIEPKDFSAIALSELSKIAEVQLWDGKDLDQFIADKDCLFIRLSIEWNNAILSKAKALKYLCSPTTGLNHIDLNYCESNEIQVISLKVETSFLNTIRATPEHTLGLIIALLRNYAHAFIQKAEDWNRDAYKGDEIYGNTIGIIGLGRVGAILADYLHQMGAFVRFYDPNVTHDIYPQSNSIQDLIDESQIIVLCSSYDLATGSILSHEHLDAMQNKYFVNTARAELYDESYMVQLASKHHFKGLAIDVIQNEQGNRQHLQALLDNIHNSNLIVTPHIAGATHQSMPKTELFIAQKLTQLI